MINKYVEAVGLASTRDMAIVMARRGFRVFPLLPNTRIPFQWNMDDPRERNCSEKDRALAGGIHRATRDEDKINSWFDHDLDPAFAEYEGRAINYGIAAAGLVILDVDVKGGKPGVEDLLSLGRLPETFTVGTTTGGMHLYFGGAEVGQKPLTKAIDIRSRGGYVVGPGSVIDGKRYKIVDDVPIATVPDKLLDRLKRAADPAEKTATPVTELDKPEAIEIAVAIAKREPPAPIHGRNNEAFALACRLKDFGLSAEKTFDVLDEHWNARNAAPEPLDEAELRRCCENAYAYGRYAPGVQNAAVEFEDIWPILAEITAGAPRKPSPGYMSRCMADIEEKPIDWFWEDRIALGKITLIGGPPKMAKSTVTCALAGATTTGGRLPDGTHAPLGSVVFITGEDDAADTIRPRLRAAGADLTKVHLFDFAVVAGRDGSEAKQHFDVGAHTANLRRLIEAIGDVRLVVIDPVLAYMGRADSHKTGDVRGALLGLQEMTAALGVATILITHLNKNEGGQTAMNRFSASGAFTGVARSVWMIGRDPDDETGDRRLMLPVGANIGNDKDGFAFRVAVVDLGNRIKTTKVVFEPGAVRRDADDLIKPKDEAVQDAERFLKMELGYGERPVKDVQDGAKRAGISYSTLRRAAEKLRVQKRKVGAGNWTWRLAGKIPSASAEFSDLSDEGEDAHIPTR